MGTQNLLNLPIGTFLNRSLFFLFNPTMKLSVMLLGLRFLLAHSATMHENDKARNANRQNEDAQDNIVENEITTIDEQHEANDKARNFNVQNEDAQNEKTTIDEQIRENKFSEISDERKENAASENRQRMQKIPPKLKKHATSRQMFFMPKPRKRTPCQIKCSKRCLPLLGFILPIPWVFCLGSCNMNCPKEN